MVEDDSVGDCARRLHEPDGDTPADAENQPWCRTCLARGLGEEVIGDTPVSGEEMRADGVRREEEMGLVGVACLLKWLGQADRRRLNAVR